MRNIFAALMLGLFVAGCGGTQPLATPPTPAPQFPAATKAALDGAVSQWLATFKAPGVVVGIWTPGGSYVTAKGVSNVATGDPMGTGDHFRIGSITKTFTITVLLQLADEKVINLDDPVSKYVSYVPNGRNITLRQMANMTSGLFNYSEDPGFFKEITTNPNRVWTPRELIDLALAHEPYFAPGKGIHYSNTNTVILGTIIESLTHEPIAQVFQERIFTPLGLTNTTWPTTAAMPVPYAHGITNQTASGKTGDATYINPSWAFTAGQMISNLNDLHVWVDSYTQGTLISPAMQQQRLQWIPKPGNPNIRYGLGIGYFNGWLGHTGELPGYNCGAFYLPSADATIVIEVNSDIGAGGQNPAPALFQDLAKIVTPNDLPY
jgi:D-alanyl-D-alanine carboxypeptidase